MSETNQSTQDQAGNLITEHSATNMQNPLYGVKGWLKFFVVINLYISPVIFVLRYIMAWVGFTIIAKRHPGIIPVGLIETVITGFLVLKWIQIARRIRDIAPGVIQEVKLWLKIVLAWSILNIPLVFMTGMDADDLLPGAIKGIITSLIAFAIWYSYFNVSKRVKATYPDSSNN